MNRPWLREFLDHLRARHFRSAAGFLGRWIQLRFRKRVVHPICGRAYRDPYRDIRRSILIAGTGRSGTTWLSEIVGRMLSSRTMFEPFHSEFVQEFRDYATFHYARPLEEDDRLLAYCQTVFSGTIRHPWVDRQVGRIFPRHRVIKEIRANLFLKWIQVHFPDLPTLFVIRHPCAVVLSRMRGNWETDAHIAVFLSQPKLVEDFLGERLDFIRSLRTDEEKHAVVWCISNVVPLRQFQPGEVTTVFYENLCLRPEHEVARIRGVLEASGMEPRDARKSLKHIETPSSTTRQKSSIMTGNDKIRQWQDHLSSSQIDRVLSIVEAFQLDFLYDDSAAPLPNPWNLPPP